MADRVEHVSIGVTSQHFRLSFLTFIFYFWFCVVDKKRYGVKVAHKRKSLIGLIESNKDVVVGRNGIHIFPANGQAPVY